MAQHFSWENPDVLQLFDTYIHGFSLSQTKMDKSHIEQPEAKSLTAVAQALSEKYPSAFGINRHTVRHQVDKRKRALNIPKTLRSMKRAKAVEESTPASRKKRGRPLKYPRNETNGCFSASSTTPKSPSSSGKRSAPATTISRTNGIPTPVTNQSPSLLPRNLVTPPNPPEVNHSSPTQPNESFLNALNGDSVRIELVETLRRARVLIDAQIQLTTRRTAYFERELRGRRIFDLNGGNEDE